MGVSCSDRARVANPGSDLTQRPADHEAAIYALHSIQQATSSDSKPHVGFAGTSIDGRESMLDLLDRVSKREAAWTYQLAPTERS